MAGMRPRGDGWHCMFRFRGRRFYFAERTLTEAKAAEVDEMPDLIGRGRLTVHEGVSFKVFVAANGQVSVVSARPETTSARRLFDHYLKTYGSGTIEASSFKTARTLLNQVAESLGRRDRIQSTTGLILQEHVDQRRKQGVADPRGFV
jgi:hypothetical protein